LQIKSTASAVHVPQNHAIGAESIVHVILKYLDFFSAVTTRLLGHVALRDIEPVTPVSSFLSRAGDFSGSQQHEMMSSEFAVARPGVEAVVKVNV
jgi:hypothetical protein